MNYLYNREEQEDAHYAKLGVSDELEQFLFLLVVIQCMGKLFSHSKCISPR